MKKKYPQTLRYLALFMVVLIISFGIAFSTNSINKQSTYVAPKYKSFPVEDDNGYTEHSSGWPVRFYTYATFRSPGALVTTDGGVEWGNFILDVMVFAVPLLIIIPIVVNKSAFGKPSK